jgi:hypothetical protein
MLRASLSAAQRRVAQMTVNDLPWGAVRAFSIIIPSLRGAQRQPVGEWVARGFCQAQAYRDNAQHGNVHSADIGDYSTLTHSL